MRSATSRARPLTSPAAVTSCERASRSELERSAPDCWPIGSPSAVAAESSSALTKGDAAILRFLAALEILEADLWQQYNELGGIQDREVPGGSGNTAYTEALETMDDDMPQYIHDNTDNEFSHFKFINAYLDSKGAKPVNLDRFRTLPSSKATVPGRRRAAHQPHEANRGHKLVHPLPQLHEEPRSSMTPSLKPSQI